MLVKCRKVHLWRRQFYQCYSTPNKGALCAMVCTMLDHHPHREKSCHRFIESTEPIQTFLPTVVAPPYLWWPVTPVVATVQNSPLPQTVRFCMLGLALVEYRLLRGTYTETLIEGPCAAVLHKESHWVMVQLRLVAHGCHRDGPQFRCA